MLNSLSAEDPLQIDHLLQISEDLTGELLNVFHDFTSSNYTFEEDSVTNEQRKRNDQHHKVIQEIDTYEFHDKDLNSHEMNRDQIYKLCTNTVVNSSIAVSCGPYYDQDIMNAIEICFNGEDKSIQVQKKSFFVDK